MTSNESCRRNAHKNQLSSERLFRFVSDIAADTVSSLITGTTNTVSDATASASCLMNGRYREAADIAVHRAGCIAQGAVEMVRNGAAVTVACCDTVLSDKAEAPKEERSRNA